MARQTGLIQLRGSIGNVRNYRLTGDKFITSALKGGPSPEDIANLPQFEQCRLRNKEWEGVQAGVKLYRYAMGGMGVRLYDRLWTSRIVKTFFDIVQRDSEHAIGERNLLLSGSWPLVTTIQPFLSKPVQKAFNGTPSFRHDITGENITCQFDFDTIAQGFNFKNAETHVRVMQIVSGVPDLLYSSFNRNYSPTSPLSASVKMVTISPWYAKSSISDSTFTVTTDFSNYLYFTESGAIVQMILVEFAQMNAEVYTLTNNFGMSVVDTFGGSF